MQGTESNFSDDVDDVQFVFAVNNSVTNTPTVETRICDTNISFLIDTGVSINIIDYQSYQKIYPRPKLQPHSPMIYAYGSQSALPVIGNFSTQIIHKNANTTSTFYVVKTDSKLTDGNLLSGETAQKLGILQFTLSSSMQANVTPMNVSEQFHKLFADGVVRISDIKINFISTRQCSQCPSDTDVFHFMSEKMLRPNSTDWRNWISLRRSMVQLHGSANCCCTES